MKMAIYLSLPRLSSISQKRIKDVMMVVQSTNLIKQDFDCSNRRSWWWDEGIEREKEANIPTVVRTARWIKVQPEEKWVKNMIAFAITAEAASVKRKNEESEKRRYFRSCTMAIQVLVAVRWKDGAHSFRSDVTYQIHHYFSYCCSCLAVLRVLKWRCGEADEKATSHLVDTASRFVQRDLWRAQHIYADLYNIVKVEYGWIWKILKLQAWYFVKKKDRAFGLNSLVFLFFWWGYRLAADTFLWCGEIIKTHSFTGNS